MRDSDGSGSALRSCRAMRVSEVTEFGGPEVLRVAERPEPSAAPGEVVVRIAAANVNPSDLAARSGAVRRRMPSLEPPFVAGWDLAGEVADAGDRSSPFAAGDPVVGMIPWIQIGGRTGAYAEAAAVDPAWLVQRPAALDPVAAATIPLNALTARQALDLLALEAGATLLVTGASGAVGGFATQLAVADGLRVLAIASDGDEDWVAALGPAEVLARDTDLGALAPVDGLLDSVPVGAAAVAAVREGGMAVFTRGVSVDGRDDLTVHTPLVRPDADALTSLVQAVAAGRLRTRVAATLSLEDAAEAHRLAEQGGNRGKLVLTTG
jgi:NADPH2:quinone reductase